MRNIPPKLQECMILPDVSHLGRADSHLSQKCRESVTQIQPESSIGPTVHVIEYLHPRTLTRRDLMHHILIIICWVGGTSPMKVPIYKKYIVQNNSYRFNSLNNLIKQVKECVRINFILIKKDNKMKLY